MNPMKVSVVMCTYNGSLFVREQLQSILQQTYPIKEIVIYDDASTDDTVKIINEIAESNALIKVFINEKNIGFTKNFEKALRAAEGDAIAISDQDDIWVESKIEKLVAAWKNECPVIYCASTVFSKAIPYKPMPHRHFKRFEGTDARKIFLYNSVSGHAMLLKKSFLPLVFPFEENVMYDWWIAVVAAYNGGVQYYPEVLVLQRKHENNITIDTLTKTPLNKYDFKKTLIRHLEKFASAPGIKPSHKNFLKKYFILLQKSIGIKFYWPLYKFIFKNRIVLFNYKKRKKGLASYIKNSYLITRKNT